MLTLAYLIVFGTPSRWPSISSVHDSGEPARTVVVKNPMNGFSSGIRTGIPVDPSGSIFLMKIVSTSYSFTAVRCLLNQASASS
jgi:hypothetical protein